MLKPLQPQSPARVAWEEKLTALVEKEGFTRSDAQGVLEANADLIDSCYDSRATANGTLVSLRNRWRSNARVQKVMVCSTGSIPKSTAEALGMTRELLTYAPLWSVLAYESWGDYGWMLSTSVVGDDVVIRQLDNDGHGALCRLLEHATRIGCEYLLLDCDADATPGFSTFDW